MISVLIVTVSNSQCYVFISRGKEFGHDVDFIVTTPERGRERSLLPDIIDRFKQDVSMP